MLMYRYNEFIRVQSPRTSFWQLLQRTLKNYALWKFFQSTLNLGPSQRTLKKNILFSKCVIMSHINALILIYLKNASISSNVLLSILSIVRSIVMGLKNYYWDKSGFASCKLNQFCRLDSVRAFLTDVL